MSSMPTLFVSHGSPMRALDAGRPGALWRALGNALPRPRAILAVSAHWLTAAPALSASPAPETIHDFGGFPAALFALQYPAPGAPELAVEANRLLAAHGLAAQIDGRRGLDHGVWTPLRQFYPQADIPVIQLAVQPQLGPAHHLALGQALAPLREQDVLIFASGSLTHNLREIAAPDSPEAAHTAAFRDWIAARLAANDLAALLDYRRRAPGGVRAHPTDEHLLPLFVALGAGRGEAALRFDAGVDHGTLAMDCYSWGLTRTALDRELENFAA